MSGGHRFNKKFSSLEKRSLGGTVQPVNSLRNTDNYRTTPSSPIGPRITAKDQLTDIFGEQVDNSRSLRKKLEQRLEAPEQVVESADSDDSGNTEDDAKGIKTVSGKFYYRMKGNIESNLGELLVVRSILFNGELIQQAQAGELVFRISTDNKFLFFTKKERIVVAISRECEFKRINFSINKRAILIELIGNWGYIYLKYTENDSNILSHFLKNKDWNVSIPTRVVNDLLLEKIRIVKQKRAEHSRKKIESKKRLPTISPDRMYGRTRSSSRISAEASPLSGNDNSFSVCDQDLVKPSLVPKLFQTELKYLFSDNKIFTITYSDFKTLYDNDWINDSLIDFFIKYEMDKAVNEKHLFERTDIYAFNSFFFTKLMSGDELEGPIDYYDNIRRWLNKLDLMSYPNIIIPINENLHWYCCLIKGLPQLLESALKKKEQLQLLPLDLGENEEEDKNDNSDLDCDSPSDSLKSSPNPISETTTAFKKKYQPEIFIFDSLRQKHSNIYFPLKKFIIDYCKEKYDVNIEKNEIRMHSAKVPKQNNFNDCGIHVIYNVRKWLNNSDECERIWRSTQLRSASRLLFIAEERNGMRRELRNILLNLKKKQLAENMDTSKDNSYNADDDIEVIEYTPVAVKGRNQNEKTNVKENLSVDSSVKSSPDSNELHESPMPRTLDPKAKILLRADDPLTDQVKSPETPSHNKIQQRIKNKTLRKFFSDTVVSETFQDVLNEYFTKHEGVTDMQLQRVLQLKNKINELDDEKDRSLIIKSIESFVEDERNVHNTNFDQEMRPKDEDFVIMHCSDNEELNRSVNGLSLSNTSETKYNATPSQKNRGDSITSILEQSSPIGSDTPQLVDLLNNSPKQKGRKQNTSEPDNNLEYENPKHEIPTGLQPVDNTLKYSSSASLKSCSPKLVELSSGSAIKRRKLDADKNE